MEVPGGAAYSLPANGVLLIVTTAPNKTRLADGINIARPGGAPKNLKGAPLYLVAPKLRIPDDGKFLLLLRNASNQNGKAANIIDVAGGGGKDTDAFIADKASIFRTDIWPLRSTRHPGVNTEEALVANAVWRRARANLVGYHKDAWAKVGHTGLGYDLGVKPAFATGGTPGYPNNAVKSKAADFAAHTTVSFSEIMVAAGNNGQRFPQWLEIYNSSQTQAVNLKGWKLEIQNANSPDLGGKQRAVLTLERRIVLPQQRLLIFSANGKTSGEAHFPSTRRYSLYYNKAHRAALGMKNQRDTVLSAVGFRLQLRDGEGTVVETAGNLAGAKVQWPLPSSMEKGARSSLVRQYTPKGLPTDGTRRAGWVRAASLTLKGTKTYYGHPTDIGTPGYGNGGPPAISTAGDAADVSPVVKVNAATLPPIYWINTASRRLYRLTGANVANIVSSVQNATSIVVDVTRQKLYWTEQTGPQTGRIRSANLDGTNVALVKELTSVPRNLAIDVTGGKLYLTNSWGKIQRLNVGGSGFHPNLITGLTSPQHLALEVSGGKVYWTVPGSIWRANLNGTNREQLVANLGEIGGLTVAGSRVYWTEKAREAARGSIRSAARNGADVKTLATLQSVPLGIAVDTVGRKLYWTNARGKLQRANLAGKQIQDAITGLGMPTDIVLGRVTTTPAAAPAVPSAVAPEQTALLPNYPNPFNPETWLPYHLAKPAEVTVTITAANGAVVRTLELGYQQAGHYDSQHRAAYWDGRNAEGEPVASGMYFYTLTAGEFTATRKMLILK